MWWIVLMLKILGGAIVFCTIFDLLFKRGRNWGNQHIRPRYMGYRDQGGSRVAVQAARIARTLEQDVQNKRTGIYDRHFNHEERYK